MITVMVAGAVENDNKVVLAAKTVLNANGMTVTRLALGEKGEAVKITDNVSISFVSLSHHKWAITQCSPSVIVDFTDVVGKNVDLYCECRVPFIMVGVVAVFRKERIEKTVRESEICAMTVPPDYIRVGRGIPGIVRFLSNQKREKGRVFSIMDVLRG